MPWAPELFSAPVLEHWLERRRLQRLIDVPFFDGLMSGELDALVGSFAGEPELHHPVRGRIKGARAFTDYVTESSAWIAERNVEIEDVERVITEQRGFEEVVLHLDGDAGRVSVPVALVADHRSEDRLDEVRLYFSRRVLTGRHRDRPPLLQRDPELHAPDVVAEHLRALAAGDVEAVVATFEADGYTREPPGDVHRGHDALRAFYAARLADGGGIPLEPCALVDDGRACALEYNVVREGAPQAGVAVFIRAPGGKLAAARIYDDIE
jgi:hypothetical protein